MTKEEWEHWREQPNIPIDVWFSFYKEKGGKLDSLEVFTTTFMAILDNKMIIHDSQGVAKEVSNASAFRKMKEYYDNQFGL